MMLKEDHNSNQVITFGCRLNSFESETIKQAINQSGEILVADLGNNRVQIWG